MNWMGGARNRVKFQNERKTQKDFFERRRLNLGRSAIPNKAWTRKRKLSQDLMALETVSAFHSKVPSTGIGKPSIKSVDLDKFKSCTEHFQEVDMGPVSPTHAPSKLFVMDCKGDGDNIKSATKTEEAKNEDIKSTSLFKSETICHEISKKKTEEWAKQDYSSFSFRKKRDDSVLRKKLQTSTYDPFVSEDFQSTPLVSYEASRPKRLKTGLERTHYSVQKGDVIHTGTRKSVERFPKYTCTSTPFDKRRETSRKRKGPFKEMLNFDLSPIGISKDLPNEKQLETMQSRDTSKTSYLSASSACELPLQPESWQKLSTDRSFSECLELEPTHKSNKQPQFNHSYASETCNFSTSATNIYLNRDSESKSEKSSTISLPLEVFSTVSLQRQSCHSDVLPDCSLNVSRSLGSSRTGRSQKQEDRLPYHSDRSTISRTLKLFDTSHLHRQSLSSDNDRSIYDTSSLYRPSDTAGFPYPSDTSPLHRQTSSDRQQYHSDRSYNRSSSVPSTVNLFETQQSNKDRSSSVSRTLELLETNLPNRHSALSLYKEFSMKTSPYVGQLAGLKPSDLQSIGEKCASYQSGQSLSETPSKHRIPTRKPSFREFDDEFMFTPRRHMCNPSQLTNKKPDIMNLYGRREITNTPKSNHSDGPRFLQQSPKIGEEFPSHLQRNHRLIPNTSILDTSQKFDTENLQDKDIKSAANSAHRKDMSDVLEEMTQMEKEADELKKASQERHNQQQELPFLPDGVRSESFEADRFFESEYHEIMIDTQVDVEGVSGQTSVTVPLNSTYTTSPNLPLLEESTLPQETRDQGEQTEEYGSNEESLTERKSLVDKITDNSIMSRVEKHHDELRKDRTVKHNDEAYRAEINGDLIDRAEQNNNYGIKKVVNLNDTFNRAENYNDAGNKTEKHNDALIKNSDLIYKAETYSDAVNRETFSGIHKQAGKTSYVDFTSNIFDNNTTVIGLADEGNETKLKMLKPNKPSVNINSDSSHGGLSDDSCNIQIGQPVCFENIKVTVQDPEVSSGKDHGIQCVIKHIPVVVDRGTSPLLVHSNTEYVDAGVQCDKVFVDVGVQCVIDADKITSDPARIESNREQVDTWCPLKQNIKGNIRYYNQPDEINASGMEVQCVKDFERNGDVVNVNSKHSFGLNESLMDTHCDIHLIGKDAHTVCVMDSVRIENVEECVQQARMNNVSLMDIQSVTNHGEKEDIVDCEEQVNMSIAKCEQSCGQQDAMNVSYEERALHKTGNNIVDGYNQLNKMDMSEIEVGVSGNESEKMDDGVNYKHKEIKVNCSLT